MRIAVFGGHGDGANRIPAQYCTTDAERGYAEGTVMRRLAEKLGTIPGVTNLRTETADISWAERAIRAASIGADFAIECHSNWSLGSKGPNRGVFLVITSLCYEDGANQAARAAEEQVLARQMFEPLAKAMGLKFEIRTKKGGGNWDWYSFINFQRKRGIKHPMIVEHGYHQDFAADVNGNIEKAFQNMRRIMGVTDVTPLPEPIPGGEYYEPEVGEVVRFLGGGVFRTSNATTSTVQRGVSLCKVTQEYNGKHPYHLISTDGGGVYGWVDVANIARTAVAAQPKMRVGAKVQCNNTPLYSNSYAYAVAKRTVTGTFTVTRYIEGRAHGVMLNDGLGWVSEQDVTVIG